MVSGQKVINTFNHEQVNVAGFDTRNQELAPYRRRRTGLRQLDGAHDRGDRLRQLRHRCRGGRHALHQGLADVGALASYLVFVRQAAMPINQFTQLGNFLLNALAGAERLFAAMDLKPEVDEGRVELVQTGDAAWAWKIPEGQGGRVRAPA